MYFSLYRYEKFSRSVTQIICEQILNKVHERKQGKKKDFFMEQSSGLAYIFSILQKDFTESKFI